MALSAEERAKTRYYLGYLNTDMGGSIALGLPAASHLLFVLESSMNNLREDSEFLVRRAIAELDCIEDQLSQSRTRYATKKVDEIEFNCDEEIRLEDQFLHWSKTLADIFGAPINPFSQRHRRLRGEVTVIDPV